MSLQGDPEMRKKNLLEKKFFLKNVKWSKVLHPTRYRTGHFGDIRPSQSLGSVLENQTQQN